MMKKPVVQMLFVVAALYDGLLGAAFLFSADALFERFQVTPPNHFGYVHFPAALLIIFALMFAAIAIKPVENRKLIPYGMLLKISYCGVVGYHWLATGIPDLWKPFVIVDFVFLVLFIQAYAALGKNVSRDHILL